MDALWIIALSLMPVGLLAWGLLFYLAYEAWKEERKEQRLKRWYYASVSPRFASAREGMRMRR